MDGVEVQYDVEVAPAPRKFLEAILDIWNRGERIPLTRNSQIILASLDRGFQGVISKLTDKSYHKGDKMHSDHVKPGSVVPIKKARYRPQRSRAAGNAPLRDSWPSPVNGHR